MHFLSYIVSIVLQLHFIDTSSISAPYVSLSPKAVKAIILSPEIDLTLILSALTSSSIGLLENTISLFNLTSKEELLSEVLDACLNDKTQFKILFTTNVW